MKAVSFAEFARRDAQLAAHVEDRLGRAPCFLGTVRRDGWPRIHPVGPFVLREGRLIVTMYPRSPKRHDLLRDGRYALHGPVEDTTGGGGEVLVTGNAVRAEPDEADRAKGYVIFEFLVGEVRATSYDATAMRPVTILWTAADDSLGID